MIRHSLEMKRTRLGMMGRRLELGIEIRRAGETPASL